MNLYEYLTQKTYPGRFLLAGTTKDNHLVLAYAIMGRSEQSRNRIFVKEENMLKTKAYDESLLKDPELIIYNAMRIVNDDIILTNGDQTDTIAGALSENKSLQSALVKRTYEPDAPNFTPRISIVLDSKKLNYVLSILKKDGEETSRLLWQYPATPGFCHVIHTYENDGNPLPSFSTDPLCFELPQTEEELKTQLWDGLNQDNKISLYVRYDNSESIINKNGEKNA